MNAGRALRVFLGAAVAAAIAGCGINNDEDQIGQATGDTMASLDESAQGGGFAELMPFLRVPAPLKPARWEQAFDALIPEAYADSCLADTFTACSAGVRTRTFSACSIGPASLSGTVTLTFSQSDCSMLAAGDSVTRDATFTLTAPDGASYNVTSPNGGQTLTVNATDNGFSFTVGGIERVATKANGTDLFDISTSTTSPISVTGLNRAGRVLNGGTLQVVHNIRKYTVDLSPSNVTYAAGCNCAVSGDWSGTASGSITGSFDVNITGCGTADVTVNGGKPVSVDYDRCASL